MEIKKELAEITNQLSLMNYRKLDDDTSDLIALYSDLCGIAAKQIDTISNQAETIQKLVARVNTLENQVKAHEANFKLLDSLEF